ncbi:MAG: 3-hydroxyacyl-CoA dehydrogenase NAD-binding domain-containing protein [Gemmatimonadaceae bacterium]
MPAGNTTRPPTVGADTIVGVLGAGAMGSGIAHVAAAAGHRVVVGDSRPEALAKAEQGIRKSLVRDVEKRRVDRARADQIVSRIRFAAPHTGAVGAPDYDAFGDCGLVIEAIVEDLEIKRDAFRRLERSALREAILATNTSSLAVTAIASACARAGRVVGVHFFNPAPVMPLVEIVPGLATDPAVTSSVRALVDSWAKTTVLAKDTPGFIVNRVARPFYGESLRILDEGIADVPTIDWAMRTIGGFRMGPFELMDLIGLDVNYAVTRSVFEALYFDPRYRPSLTQRRLIEAGFLGRKSDRGFYDYRDGARAPEPAQDPELGREVVMRVLAMLVNEAADAVFLNVASVADVELAMTKGVNYPKGLLAWGEEIGLDRILERVTSLQSEYGEDRYRPSPLLRRMVRDGKRFTS